MEPATNHRGQQEFLRRIKALMLLRVLVLTGFLGAIVVFQSDLGLPNIIPISTLIATTYVLTLVYAIVLKRVRNLTLFCYIQIAADVLIEGGVIFITGGIDSPFSILFNFSIISATIILSRKAGYITASLSTITFGALLDLEFYGMLHPIRVYPPSPMSEFGDYVFNIIYLNFCAFFIIAFLSGFLVEKLRSTHEELVEKSDSLDELQAFHENVVRYMGDGLLTTGIDWVITSFNQAAERITGYAQEEVRGKSIVDVLPFLEDKILGQTMSTLPSSFSRSEGKFIRKDGKEIDVGVNLSGLLNNINEVKGCIAVFQDLTYLKEMEKKLVQTERLAAIGQMSASLAHEIRNPLASLSGSTEVLRGELHLSGPNMRLMDIVVEEANRLNQIISQFLDFANPKPAKFTQAKIAPLIENTVALLKNSREFKQNVEIKMALNDGGLFCNVDPLQVRQVLWNLCLNGIQAMPEGGCLEISTEKWPSSDSPVESVSLPSEAQWKLGKEPPVDSPPMLRIDIQDQGGGIHKENGMKIFEPFFTTKERGTGLGLATVHRAVENHKGFITLESKMDFGATFSIFLPLGTGQK